MVHCVHCGESITPDNEVCPHCSEEQPVEWMVKLVYVLAFLFIQGVTYRLLWPRAESFAGYAAYFVLTGGIALAVWAYIRKRTSSEK